MGHILEVLVESAAAVAAGVGRAELLVSTAWDSRVEGARVTVL